MHQDTVDTRVARRTDVRTDAGTDGETTGAFAEILGVAAIALIAMGLLAFGYNTRERNTETARGGEMSIQAQQPARNDRVAPTDTTPAPTTSTSGQGPSNGEPAPAPR